jgi:signal transduction histidine kinase/DNA-binding response OmpR family regulator
MTAAVAIAPRILIVDDTPANLVALGAVLKSLSTGIVEAATGAQALQAVEREQFAVVVLDVQMPIMDGFETARRIRSLQNGRGVPIVFMTAIYRNEEYAKRAYAGGAADYITKPFDPDVLRARVKAYVDLFRERDEAHRARLDARTRERDDAQRWLFAFECISTTGLEGDGVEPFLRALLAIFLNAAESADSAAILLRERDELRVCASVGAGDEFEANVAVPVGAGFAGKIAESGRPLSVVCDESEPIVGWKASRGIRSIHGVPLVSEGEVIGVAQIASTRSVHFSDAERRLLAATGERAAWVVARHRARERLYDVLHSAPALISVWRGQGHVCEFANDAFRRQHADREVVGKRGSELGITPDLLAVFDRVLQSGETISVAEHAARADFKGEGLLEDRFFDFTVRPLRDGLGRPDAILLFAVDLTSQVLARRALEHSEHQRAQLLELERAARREAELANRSKDEFLATVSHELRTPLNAILGWTTTLRRGVAKDTDRAVAHIERNARAQARIVDDVLDISRIARGKLRLDVVVTDISRALFGAVESVRVAAEAKGVAVAAQIDDDLGTITADADRIQQVVWNLLSNGVKFTPKGGQVRISAWRLEESVAVSVVDTGQGIATDFLRHIFEPFRQADASTTRRHGGVGLGLAIVKELVAAHGGTIRAESGGVGLGASFTMTLPTGLVADVSARGRQREEVRALREGDLARLDDVRVLVVDDEEDSRALMCDLLSGQGAVVELAASAAEALRTLSAKLPDVLISDIAMPETDGYAFIQGLRALPAKLGGAIPAIALTAYARAEDRQLALNSGFQMHLVKPFDPSELVSHVARLAHAPATCAFQPD